MADTEPHRVDSRNRVVLPKEIREELKIEPGDYVVYRIESDGVRVYKAEWDVRDD